MTLRVITKVSEDEEGWLNEVTWREAERLGRYLSAETRASTWDMQRALDRGDTLALVAASHAGIIEASELLERVDGGQGVRFRLRPQSEGALFLVERYAPEEQQR